MAAISQSSPSSSGDQQSSKGDECQSTGSEKSRRALVERLFGRERG